MAMGISRPSFGRVLRNGRKVIANALVNGKIIKIRTGNVQVGVRQRNFPVKNKAAVDIISMQTQLKEDALRRNIAKFIREKAPKM
jgi:hypothetical protein